MAKVAQGSGQTNAANPMVGNLFRVVKIGFLCAAAALIFLIWYSAAGFELAAYFSKHHAGPNERDQISPSAGIANTKSPPKMNSPMADRSLVADTWKKLWPGTTVDDWREVMKLTQRGGGAQLRKQADEGDVVAALTLLRYKEMCLSLSDSFEPLPTDVRPGAKILTYKDCLPFFGDDVEDRRRLKSLALGWMQTAAESRFDLAVIAYFQMTSEIKDTKEGFMPQYGGPTLADHASFASFLLRSAADEGSFGAAYVLMNAYNNGVLVEKNAELASRYAKIAASNPGYAAVPGVRRLAKLD